MIDSDRRHKKVVDKGHGCTGIARIVSFEISGEVSESDPLVQNARSLLVDAGVKSFDSAIASNSLLRGG